ISSSTGGSIACPSAASGSGCCSSATACGTRGASGSRRTRAAWRRGPRFAACFCTTRSSSCSPSRTPRSTCKVPSCSTRSCRSCTASGRSSCRRTIPLAWNGSRRCVWHSRELRRRRPRSRAQGSPAGAARARHAPRDAPLRRRRVRRLPLRAAGSLVVACRARPSLGGDRLHRAARARTGVRSRARAADTRCARARAGRPERDLGGEDDRHAGVSRGGRGRRPAALRALLPRARRRDDRCVRARGRRHLRRRDLRRGDGRGDTRPRPPAAPALLAPRDPDRDRGRRGLGRRRAGPLSRLPGPLRPAVRARLLGGIRVRRRRMSAPAAQLRLMSRVSLPALAAASFLLVTTALVLVFFVAPNDADQGFSQRIFYFHVSIAFTAYACFIGGAWKALVHLWKRDPRADLESYVGVHQGVIFGALVLLTGSIWAKISWGHWWLWSENQLVLFLVLFLFYCAYFMLRFSVEDGPQRANLSAVYALFGVILIPVSFLAIRL